MPENQKETVIIVHGTWANPEPGLYKWYQLDGSASGGSRFVTRLDGALARRGSSARCWAHCKDETELFSWSGENSWIDRTRASAELAIYVARLESKGWRCHIVGHSHGGNIIADALPAMAATPRDSEPGKVVTLGTPFLDVMRPINWRSRIRHFATTANRIAIGVIALLVLLYGPWEAYHNVRAGRFSWEYASIMVLAMLVCIPPAIALLLSLPRKVPLPRFMRRRPDTALRQVLVLGSSFDEAWQVLHHMRALKNPLAIDSNVLQHLMRYRRNSLSQSKDIERIHGVKRFSELSRSGKVMNVFSAVLGAVLLMPIFFVVGNNMYEAWSDAWYYGGTFWEVVTQKGLLDFAGVLSTLVVVWVAVVAWGAASFGATYFSTVWAPLRWIRRQLGAIAALPGQVVEYVVRRRAWSIVQESVMGLHGYRYALPRVERAPSSGDGYAATYEDMPKGAEERAMQRRDEWIGRHFGMVSETLSKVVLTSTDISALLRMVENDLSLVHAAYYTDDLCVERVADWIAGTTSGSTSAR